MCPGARWCQGNVNKPIGWLPLGWDRALRAQAHFLHPLNTLPNKNGNISASPVVFVWPFVRQRRSLADDREQASCAWIWVLVWIWLPPPLNLPLSLEESLTPGPHSLCPLLSCPQKSQFHLGERHCSHAMHHFHILSSRRIVDRQSETLKLGKVKQLARARQPKGG